MRYNPGQAAELFPHVPPETKWFILAGPADANEAQTFHERFPDVKIIGFEPNPQSFLYQLEQGFPGVLLPVGLWSSRDYLKLKVPGNDEFQRSGSVIRFVDEGDWPNDIVVSVETLDEMSRRYGPFEDAVLWADVEFAELELLRGAQGLLHSGAIKVINVELHTAYAEQLDGFLRWNEYREVARRDVREMPSGVFWDASYTR